MNFLRPWEIAPALIANALLLFGLRQMGSFQKQERPWRNALDRAMLFGVANLGLCPFLFWFNRMPGQFYFRATILVLVISASLFLFNLNVMLRQLGAMLPDETLRQDLTLFTALNRWMLAAWLLVISFVMVVPQIANLSAWNPDVLALLQRGVVMALLFLGLLPLAVTMALIWKTKEVIFDSVFGAK
jgi:hypothetical protein